MLKDKIGILEQQLESLQKAAALEMSAREALESSAKEAIEQAAEGKKAVEAANIAVAEAMQRGRVSLMQVCFLAVFFHVFLLGDGCTSGSVVRGVDVGTDHVAGEHLF